MKTLDEVIEFVARGLGDSIREEVVDYLQMYRSDQIQYQADRKHWETYVKQEMDRLNAARDNYVAGLKELKQNQRKWISVADRMPENDEIMAIRCVTKKGVVTWNRAWYDGQFWHGSGSFAEVTHWMPIDTNVNE